MNSTRQFGCRGLGVVLLASLAIPAHAQQIMRVANNVTPQPPAPAHPIDQALGIARASLDHMRANVDDYTALFVKRTRVDGVLPPLQYAHLKLRNRKVENGRLITPMSVYLDFLKPADVRGREVIWVEDQNEGKLVAHQGGLSRFVTLYLDPTGYVAMRGQKYPITDIGIENLLIKIIESGERARQHGGCEVQIFQDAKVGDEVCTMVQVTHPVKQPHFDFYRARVYFSNRLNMPIRYKSWLWPTSPDGQAPVQEEYNYLKLNVNVALTAQDFDQANPAYRYH